MYDCQLIPTNRDCYLYSELGCKNNIALFETRMAHIHENPDKKSHDKARGDRSHIFPLHPFRAVLISPPGGGKRQTTLEIIGRHPKAFDTITVMHHAPTTTVEYDVLGDNIKMIGEDVLPDVTFWDRNLRNLLVIDEINISDKKPAYKKRFDRLFNYASTHHSLSIVYQLQDAFSSPVSVRRACNHFRIWRASDAFVVNNLGRRLGIKNMAEIFREKELDFGPHDHLWVDLSGNGPPLRKNISTIINVSD